ncbi:ABC transporter ATP-binding protein/permease [Streptococcus sciuri]|uniref:ABC transporter ATP-binding protein/permease n=1 Tax=Streptococcus sciuri TaxID=2973939 RepID=A0ABT2F5V0_9STRE|nr:ABC transporter ATP-binding protein/permease [Streptococcus sciuri]MCS4487833.1 ABC transporter ATP-binding protein/permease [Streptococcus sciuri]
MANSQPKKISRERKKALLKRLKEQVSIKKSLIYRSAILSWIQFLMRVASFALIAYYIAIGFKRGFEQLNWTLFVLIILGLNLTGFLVASLAKKFQGIVSQYARNQLKMQFFEAFQTKAAQFEDSATAADVLTVASQGIDSLDTYYGHYLNLSFRTYFNCATILILITFLYPLGGVIFLLCLPLIPISIVLMQKRSRHIMDRYWGSYMDVGNRFMDNLSGLNTLYTYQADDKYAKDFAMQAEEFRQATMLLLRFQLQSVGYMDAVMYLGVGLAGFVAVMQLLAGHISLFTMIFFILIATEFFAPIREMGYGMHLVMMNTKMADRIFSFLDGVKKSTENKNGSLSSFSDLKVKNVSFGYTRDKQVLSRLDFTLEKGQVLAVAGASGQGKTTLSALLTGSLIASSGDIFFGEVSISSLDKQSIAKEVVYVSSESYLFNKTIYDNLVMARPMTKEEVLSWADTHGVLQFIHELPEGLDTPVGENGRNLSNGQRQQILCARGVLAKRSLYIFDEMTSSVDRDNERAISELIHLISKEAMVIIITHKMAQVMVEPYVLYLDNTGAHFDSPQALYEKVESFRNLVDTQANLERVVFHENKVN